MSATPNRWCLRLLWEELILPALVALCGAIGTLFLWCCYVLFLSYFLVS